MKPKFNVGQVVKLKDKEELISANLRLIYRIDETDFYQMENAEVTVCKILGERQLHCNGKPVFWYEVGQFGRNIVEIPETFISEDIGGNELSDCTVRQDIQGTSQVTTLLEEVSKFIKAGSLEDVSDFLFNITGTAMLKYPDALTVAIQFNNDQKAQRFRAISGKKDLTDKTFTLFLIPADSGNPESSKENLWRVDKELLERIDKEKEQVSLFAEELENLQPYDKTAGGSIKLRVVKLLGLYDGIFRKETDDRLRIEKLRHIASVARSGVQDHEAGNLSLEEVSNIQIETYRKKNADYGDSFKQSMDEDGILVAKIRIGDKIRRISSLLEKGGEGQVKDEKLQDTFLDLANYCVMTILWLKSRYKDEQ